MKEEKKPYAYEGRTVYEWDESLDTIYCYIELPALPSNVKPASLLTVVITSSSLLVGFKNTAPYLSHQLQGIADAQQSLWYIQDKKAVSGKESSQKQVVIQLQKAQKGVRWGSVFKGHKKLNVFEQQQMKKKLMLQRFQEQNPGFDFSGAEFNGQVPEARTFMGGPRG